MDNHGGISDILCTPCPLGVECSLWTDFYVFLPLELLLHWSSGKSGWKKFAYRKN